MAALKRLLAGATSMFYPAEYRAFAESLQAPMDAPFSCCVDMDNRLVMQEPLVLRWYKPLATLLAKEFTKAVLCEPHCGVARIVGASGAGTSMFRNFVARNVASTAPRDKPLLILFEGTGKPNSTIIVVHRPAGGTVFSIIQAPLADVVAFGLVCDVVDIIEDVGGTIYNLVDVSEGDLDAMWSVGAVIFFASNSRQVDDNWGPQVKAFHSRSEVAKSYYVPNNTEAEAEAWFRRKFGFKAEGANLERLRVVMSEYGPTLGVCEMLELAEDGLLVEINRRAREARDVEIRAAAKRVGDAGRFATIDMEYLRRVGGDELCVRPSLFTNSDPTFRNGPATWRSNVIRDRLLLEKLNHGGHALQAMVRAMLFIGRDGSTPVVAAAFLMMFRAKRDRWPRVPFISKSCGRVNKVPHDWWQQFHCGHRVRYFLNGAEDEQFSLIEGQLSAGQSWMLEPYDQAYPGIDAVLLSCNGGEKHALLVRITISSRHSDSHRAAATIAAWCDRVSDKGFKPWLAFCVRPQPQPYFGEQAVAGVDADQLLLTWAMGHDDGPYNGVVASPCVLEPHRVKAVKRKRDAGNHMMKVLAEWVRNVAGRGAEWDSQLMVLPECAAHASRSQGPASPHESRAAGIRATPQCACAAAVAQVRYLGCAGRSTRRPPQRG